MTKFNDILNERRKITFELTNDEAYFLAVRLELIVKEFEEHTGNPHLVVGKQASAKASLAFFKGLAEKTRAHARAQYAEAEPFLDAIKI